ncbi:MAG: hypothetical protein VR64_01490 [Desulfatitalea sp. BRH_c12]|nr:MAG: hypothetical protein VR64_01490 [Desulfatitalea sp. BRH_c12]
MKMLLQSRPVQWALMTVMLLGLPLLGIGLAGRDVRAYLTFPPLTGQVAHAPFAWSFFIFFAAVDLLFLLFLIRLPAYGYHARRRSSTGRLPHWGWAGLGIMLAGWVLAWTRWDWFAPFQVHTFFLPWFGYILLVNALCVRLTARSLLTDTPGFFWLLFPVSALFWWFFEYLNRFVQNWYYVGADFGPAAYFAFASLAFATVLPAVLSTYRLIVGVGPVSGATGILPLRLRHPRLAATVILASAGGGLTFIGLFPDVLFALLWVSPLLIITSLQTLAGRPTIFSPLTQGDWRPIVAAAWAALICGFFWELWNIGSLARWHYTVPFVDRFHVFAMPIVGYGGYLPFGLTCLAIGHMILGSGPLRITTDNRD